MARFGGPAEGAHALCGAQSAVELCDIGALKQLLSLMETHWKQLGQV
jgi:hypothetical protein